MEKNTVAISLGDLLNKKADEVVRNLFCALPGRIETYDPALTTATVSVMIKTVNEKTGDIKPYAGLVDVPVLQLSGGLAGINLPITAGDPCLVVFGDRDIDNWFATGSAQPPNSRRVHSAADGFAIVGFRPLTNPVDRPDYLAAGLYRDATQISIKNNRAAIKNGTTDLLTLLQAFCDAVISSINSIGASPSLTTVQSGSTPLSVSISKDTSAVTTAKNNLINLLYSGDIITPT